VAEIVAELAQILELNEADLTAQTPFRTLDGWDSLALISLISLIDERFGVVLGPTEINQCDSVQELIELIERP
jgi:acyl carrier protein